MKEHKNHKGYSLVEMLVVLGISSILLVVLALLFKTGIWEVGRSSGRIELVRTGRQALNQIQRYMASANAPGGLTFDGEAVKSAVYTPLDSEIYDPTKTNIGVRLSHQFSDVVSAFNVGISGFVP